jgi:hypothetical protein
MEIQKTKFLVMTVIYRENLNTFFKLLSRQISTTTLQSVRLQYKGVEWKKILKQKTCRKQKQNVLPTQNKEKTGKI